MQWSLAAPGSPVLGGAGEPKARRQHVLRLSRSRRTTSRYRLRTSSGRLLAGGTFTTAPPPLARAITSPPPATPAGRAERRRRWPRRSVAPLGPRAPPPRRRVVYPSGGREGYGPWLFQPFAQVIQRAPISPAIGNHDLETERARPGSRRCHPGEQRGAERTVLLIRQGRRPLPGAGLLLLGVPPGHELVELRRRGPGARRRRLDGVVLHYPPYSTGPSGGNADVARHLVPLFEARRVDVVLWGTTTATSASSRGAAPCTW